MLLQLKHILLSIIFSLVHSSNEDFDMGSTASDESCNKPDAVGSESNCYCYSQPEIDFEYSTCAIPNVALDTGTHDTKTEQAEEVQIFNYQLLGMLSYIFIPP
jgi:hypothetical protein